jgi:hypothetical protein
MENAFTQKNAKKFYCDNCDFKCSNKYDYARHLSTRKHASQSQGKKMENEKNAKIVCECSREYKSISGLWKHKQKCNLKHTTLHQDNNYIKDITTKDITTKNITTKDITTDILYDVLNQNKELYQILLEQNKSIIEISKNSHHNTIISNNNNNNKTFNLQVFLNETCKDAMNIMDFVESLKIQITDLENVGKLGFVNGISNIIVKNLKAMDVEKRPLHCSDSKREIVYVKDENKWEKENDNKNKLRKVIKCVAHKNSKLIPEWKANNPDCVYSDSKKSDQYNKIIIESMGGDIYTDSDVCENKIIKNITKEVIIDKE